MLDDLVLYDFTIKSINPDQFTINLNGKNIELEKNSTSCFSKSVNSIQSVPFFTSLNELNTLDLKNSKKILVSFFGIVKSSEAIVVNKLPCLKIIIVDYKNKASSATMTCWIKNQNVQDNAIYKFSNIIMKKSSDALVFSTCKQIN